MGIEAARPLTLAGGPGFMLELWPWDAGLFSLSSTIPAAHMGSWGSRAMYSWLLTFSLGPGSQPQGAQAPGPAIGPSSVSLTGRLCPAAFTLEASASTRA